MFVAKFPLIAIFINFDEFSIMVEKALQKFEELIQTNPAIGSMYSFEDMRGEEENDKL